MTVFSSRRDLETYVDDHCDYSTTAAERCQIVAAIAADAHPAYGTDWTEYLDNLPESLESLIALTP